MARPTLRPRALRKRTLGFALVALGGAVVAAAACGGEDTSIFEPDGGPGDDDASVLSDGSPSFVTDGSGGTDGGVCKTNADCNGGVCTNGICCASAATACGSTCCNNGTVCVFDQCVTPGKVCHSANDCADNEYCETALGANASDAGVPDSGPDGAVCTGSLPLSGRCVARPPSCGDGGTDGGCVAACEYHPPVGPLTPAMRWQWGYNLTANQFPDSVDVWSTPTVGRVYDGNCDGKVDEYDSPNIVFVSGDSRWSNGVGTCCQCTGNTPTACHTGVLRMVDGKTGATIWSLDTVPGTTAGFGFAGLSPALADIDRDGRLDVIVAMGDGYLAIIDSNGVLERRSDFPVETNAGTSGSFGWGGGLAVADMDGDGFPEIAYGRTVYTTKNNALTRVFHGTKGRGGSNLQTSLSSFVDLDGLTNDAGAPALELLAGHTAYRANGTVLWDRTGEIDDGYAAVGDFDKNGTPEVALVVSGAVYLLDGATGATVMGPLTLPGSGFGGPPTVADFDGDGAPEIGVAQADLYSVVKPTFGGTPALNVLWSHTNHDFSSSETGSTVFDFEGDGKAEVVYADECYLWVWGYDAVQGKPVVRFATPSTSFTATEASLVADIDGDGHAELLMVSNRANPNGLDAGAGITQSWHCNEKPWNDPSADAGRPPGTPQWVSPAGQPAGSAYRGLTAFGDSANSWVGTRTLWNEHTYHVNNICDSRDNACSAPNQYGFVPQVEKNNWSLPWLNNFRQNVQDHGIFDAPDAVVSLQVECTTPATGKVSLKNQGLKSLPAGVDVGVFLTSNGKNTQVAKVTSTSPLFPGQTATFFVTMSQGTGDDTYVARVLLDPVAPKFHECRENNNESAPARGGCTVPK